jgi:hypothetical protein
MLFFGVIPCVSVVILFSPLGLVSWAIQVLPKAEHIFFGL